MPDFLRTSTSHPTPGQTCTEVISGTTTYREMLGAFQCGSTQIQRRAGVEMRRSDGGCWVDDMTRIDNEHIDWIDMMIAKHRQEISTLRSWRANLASLVAEVAACAERGDVGEDAFWRLVRMHQEAMDEQRDRLRGGGSNL